MAKVFYVFSPDNLIKVDRIIKSKKVVGKRIETLKDLGFEVIRDKLDGAVGTYKRSDDNKYFLVKASTNRLGECYIVRMEVI